jgi:hypothetical protein
MGKFENGIQLQAASKYRAESLKPKVNTAYCLALRLLPLCLYASLPCCLAASLPRCLVASLPHSLSAFLPAFRCNRLRENYDIPIVIDSFKQLLICSGDLG